MNTLTVEQAEFMVELHNLFNRHDVRIETKLGSMLLTAGSCDLSINIGYTYAVDAHKLREYMTEDLIQLDEQGEPTQ